MENNVKKEDFEKYDFAVNKCIKLLFEGASPGGCISIGRLGNKTITGAFGYFTDRKNRHVEENTFYDLASITKIYTAAIVLHEYQQGVISIFDKVSNYLSNFIDSDIQIIDLLTHRVDFGIRLSDYRREFPEHFLDELLKIKPPENRSDQIHYANLQYIYLGEILKIVENKSLNSIYKEFLKQQELKETTTGLEIEKDKIVTPTTEIDGKQSISSQVHDESARLMGGISGNAGIFSTSRDLAKFAKLWLEGNVVSKELLTELVFEEYGDPDGLSQGLGWWHRVKTIEDKYKNTDNVYLHPGYTGSMIAINPNNNKHLAFVCNRTYYGRDNLKHRRIWNLLVDWINKD